MFNEEKIYKECLNYFAYQRKVHLSYFNKRFGLSTPSTEMKLCPVKA